MAPIHYGQNPRNQNLTPVKEPGRGTQRAGMLFLVRTKPGRETSYYAAQFGVSQVHARQLLWGLLRQGLVGRQESLGFGSYESRWTPEETDVWKKS